MSNLIKALESLRPNSQWSLGGTQSLYSEIIWYDENEVQPTEEEIQAEIERLSSPTEALREAKEKAIAMINNKAQGIADKITAGYPDFEKTTWPDQQAEALAWNLDNSTPTPYIDGMAAEREIDRVAYLERTIVKVNNYRSAAQKLVGQRQKYADQISNAATLDELDAINPAFQLE